MALGLRIRELRKLKGWSQEALSDNAHIHRTFAGSLERGEKNVSFHALVLIARCFGLTLAELFSGLETGERAKSTSRNDRPRRNVELALLQEAAKLERTVRALKAIALSQDEGLVEEASPRVTQRRGRQRVSSKKSDTIHH